VALLLPLAERVARVALRRRGFGTRVVDLGDAGVHVYEAQGHGSLPPLVVLHGIGSAAAAFARVLAGLQRHASRVIAPEMPGHGFSPPPFGVMTPDRLVDTMTRALDRLVPEPAILCGNSLGGAVALNYALARPEKVQGLVLLSPAGLRLPASDLEALRRTFLFETDLDTRRFLERLYHRRPILLPLLAREVRANMSRPVVRHLLQTVTPNHGIEPSELRKLSVPTLFVWGASERILPSVLLEGFRAHLPEHAEIEHPEGVGHCPHLDAPARTVARIVRFASEVQRRGSTAA
jgi:pimeloyl-ACP methyl ester carboxylesterase